MNRMTAEINKEIDAGTFGVIEAFERLALGEYSRAKCDTPRKYEGPSDDITSREG